MNYLEKGFTVKVSANAQFLCGPDDVSIIRCITDKDDLLDPECLIPAPSASGRIFLRESKDGEKPDKFWLIPANTMIPVSVEGYEVCSLGKKCNFIVLDLRCVSDGQIALFNADKTIAVINVATGEVLCKFFNLDDYDAWRTLSGLDEGLPVPVYDSATGTYDFPSTTWVYLVDQ